MNVNVVFAPIEDAALGMYTLTLREGYIKLKTIENIPSTRSSLKELYKYIRYNVKKLTDKNPGMKEGIIFVTESIIDENGNDRDFVVAQYDIEKKQFFIGTSGVSFDFNIYQRLKYNLDICDIPYYITELKLERDRPEFDTVSYPKIMIGEKQPDKNTEITMASFNAIG